MSLHNTSLYCLNAKEEPKPRRGCLHKLMNSQEQVRLRYARVNKGVVDCNNLHIVTPKGRAQDQASDPAESCKRLCRAHLTAQCNSVPQAAPCTISLHRPQHPEAPKLCLMDSA